MSLFRRERRADHPTDSLTELLRRRLPPGGVHVNADTAMRHSAVWACRDLIASNVSTLPVHEYRKQGSAARRLVDPPVLSQPDGAEVPASAWRYMALESLVMRGNAYGLIIGWDRRGWPSRIRMLHPDTVQARQLGPNGPVEFRVNGRKVERYQWLATPSDDEGGNKGELWHVPAYVVAGCPIGLSPIAYAARSIGLGLQAEQFGSDWFIEGAHPSGVLTSEQEITSESAALIKERFLAAVGKTREPVVLGAGLGWTPVQIAPEESQFLETIKANVADVARFFRVPPEEIGGTSGNSMTYANQEQRGIALTTWTFRPWIFRLEEALSLLRPRPRYVKMTTAAMERTDLAGRYRAYESGIRTGWLKRDEPRSWEEMEPLPNDEGQVALWPPYRSQLSEIELQHGADGRADPDDEATEPGDDPPPPADDEEVDDG